MFALSPCQPTFTASISIQSLQPNLMHTRNQLDFLVWTIVFFGIFLFHESFKLPGLGPSSQSVKFVDGVHILVQLLAALQLIFFSFQKRATYI